MGNELLLVLRWALTVTCLIAAQCWTAESARAQSPHINGPGGLSASIPSYDNDGPGNRMGRGACDFLMPSSGYKASLLVYSQVGMPAYSTAIINSPSWELLEFSGRLAAYDPWVILVNQCTNPNDRTVHQAFESEPFQLFFNEWTPHFHCPAHMPELVQAWCATAVLW